MSKLLCACNKTHNLDNESARVFADGVTHGYHHCARTAYPLLLLARELRLADVIKTSALDEQYTTAVVKQITKDGITLVRPFTVTGDFCHTGGVSVSLGWEEYSVPVDDRIYTVYARKDLQ